MPVILREAKDLSRLADSSSLCSSRSCYTEAGEAEPGLPLAATQTKKDVKNLFLNTPFARFVYASTLTTGASGAFFLMLSMPFKQLALAL